MEKINDFECVFKKFCLRNSGKWIGLYFLFFILNISAQELPPIEIFTPQDYTAEDQNWAISQGSDGQLYFANNKGLLQYNGARWQLYPSPNKSILRSVKVIGDKIYTGCYMDFGFWEKDHLGKLNYTSLVAQKEIKLIEDEQFWGIVALDDWILFQSLNRIYIYNYINDNLKIIDSKTTLPKMYRVDQTIYYQKINDGIYKIENGEEKLVSNADEITEKLITNIFEHKEGLLIQTKEDGFYLHTEKGLEQWMPNVNKSISHNSIYSSVKLKNGDLILGTVSNGIIHLDEEGNVIYKIDQTNGLSNNTILSLFEDNRGNIWLGLDNGINVININSPFRVYNDDSGVLGTVYTSLVEDGNLYLGTNQGLFYRPLISNEKFEFIEGTEGQVWSLKKIYGTVFCGHDKGTFVVRGNKVSQISKIQGAWQIQKINNHPNLIIQGTYSGLYILEKKEKKWQLRNKLEGFNISSRYFEFLNNTEILVNHEYKGVYRLQTNENLTEILNYQKNAVPKGIKSSLTKYNSSILYAYQDGILKFDQNLNKFKKDAVLSKLYDSDNYISGKLVSDEGSNRLWSFSENNISYAQPGMLTDKLKISFVPISNELRKTKVGYENLLALNDHTYLMGTTKGYVVMDLTKVEDIDYNISLNNIENYALNQQSKNLNITNGKMLPNKNNNLVFEYSVGDFNKFSPSKYKYQLLGFNENWSEWSEEPKALFKNLPYGDYTFQAKAKVGEVISKNKISYSFSIDKPWYLKPFAIIIYVVAFLLLIILIHRLNKSHYKQQQKKLLKKKEKEIEFKELNNQKQLIQFKNQNLQQDIENKNRELGISTMNLIKKNELLNAIKKELKNANKVDDFKSVVKLINNNLNTTDDWKLFEVAFNNADKDFLKKIKNKHPNLTSNDLRLCAYLRLNLASKEIAPLLNISHKSVEVKRYRLRKKMGLDHDTNLTNYILGL